MTEEQKKVEPMTEEQEKEIAPIIASLERAVRDRIKAGQIKEPQIIGVDFFAEEEKRVALLDLCELYYTNPIAFAVRMKELAPLFGCSHKYIERTVKKIVTRAIPPKVNLESREEIVEMLVQIAKRETKELWHNEYGVGYASIERDGHVENHQVEKADYQYFVSRKFGEEYGYEVNGKFELRYPPRACLREAVWHVENHARDGVELDPKHRVIAVGDALWDRRWRSRLARLQSHFPRLEIIRKAGRNRSPDPWSRHVVPAARR